jgi:hypothetical protein
MAIARLGAGAGGSSTGAAVTFNSFNLATSDANTLAVVGVVLSVSSNSTSTTCAVTYGGTAMTQLNLTLAGSSTSRSAVGIYYLFNPGTGVKSIVVTPGGSSTKAQVLTQQVAFSNVAATGVGAAQTAAALSATPTSLVGGYDVAVFGNGATLSSPNQTSEYLSGASVAGVGDYMSMQTAAGTGSAITFSVSGTATTAQLVAVALTAVPGPVSALTDNFAFKDTVKWVWGGAAALGGNASTQLVVPPDAAGANVLTSVLDYDLTESNVIVQLVQVGAAATSLYTPFRLVSTVGSNNYLEWFYNGTQIQAQAVVGGTAVAQSTPVTYSATTYAWLRIRHTAGVVYFDYSAEASTWNQALSWTVSGMDITTIYLQLYGGVSSGTVTANTIWDNVNAPPIPAITFTDDFTTKDTVKWDWGGTSTVTGGQLVMTPVGDDIASNSVVNLTGSSVQIQVLQVPIASAGLYAAFLRVQVTSGNYAEWAYTGATTFFAQVQINSSQVAASANLTFSATNHKWLRIRESGGTLYWDTAPDGLTWTNQFSWVISGMVVTAALIAIYSISSGTSSQTQIQDNVNILAAAPTGPGQFFAMF